MSFALFHLLMLGAFIVSGLWPFAVLYLILLLADAIWNAA